MLKKLLLLILALPLMATAQKVLKPVIPGVSQADVKATAHLLDTTAAAAYLYRHGNTYYELSGGYWVMVTEVYTRVKIYNKEGYEYASPELYFYSGNNKARGSFSKAATYNIENGLLVKTELKKESEFEETLEGEYTRKTIALPNVKEGSIIEYTTTIKTPYFSQLRDWYFQYDIPVNDVRYDVSIPIYFIYNVYTVGYVDVKMIDPKLTLNTKNDTNEYYYLYTATNVKAFRDEAYISNKENYIGKLEHELSIIQMPNKNPEHIATDWKAVAKSIYDHDGFGRELRFDGYFQDDVKAITAGLETPEAKLTAIFNYVQARMSWNEEDGYICDLGVKEAYKTKQGNVGDINLMLTAMLRDAGLDANPVLVSTRDHGIAIFASRLAYNYVVAAVKINDKTLLLDATSKYSKPGILPVRALNWEGRLIKKNGDTENIDLMPKGNSKEVINILADIAPDGTVTGKARDQYFDHSAYTFRELYAEIKQDSYIEKLEKDFTGLEIGEYKITNEKDLAKPVIEDYSFSNSNLADVIGNKIYISPILFFAKKTNPFKQETREYPVDFIYPYEDKFMITLKIPAGYAIESLPKPLAMAMEDNIGTFKYSVVQSGSDGIQLSVATTINFASVSKEYYKTLKDFFQKMIEKQNEKLVLVKSN
jgi:transglutaminase-like putative cysteine protease